MGLLFIMNEFKCKKCGKCCSENTEFIPLFEWEMERLQELAKEKDIKLEIKPTELVYDKRSKKAVCSQFGLYTIPCPFLIGNKCSVYSDRPIVCKAFPIAKTPLLDGKVDLSNFVKCPNFNAKNFILGNLDKKMDKFKAIKIFIDFFGEDAFYSAAQKDIIEESLKMIILNLAQTGKVKPRIIKKRRFEDYKPTPIFKFLERFGIRDLEKMKDLEQIKNMIPKS